MAHLMTKVLIANRSEIACRVIQACRELGLTSVAVCAPGDEEARHLTYADEVISISSYLSIPEMVRAAQTAKAQWVHPGYGFLSERPLFAKALREAKIGFVGPEPESMELLGEKIAAKELAEKIGVPTLPWARVGKGGDLKTAAKKVGFPLLLKASAGGGGKGMRKVLKESELESAAESASAEAMAAFGDGALFLERLVERPRHIEVQVFGDGKGGGAHLFERECSLQRRHQKVWEEAQAPNLKDATRKGLYEAALKLVAHVKYRSAGTVEFLVDDQEQFYFLEMNTRLQVEHPVTEEVTGVDLVHAQLKLALDPGTFPLAGLTARGHAIEVRLYTEDASQGFIPTPGKIEFLHWPLGAGIRIESGVEIGQTVGTQFDSMLAKVIVRGETRAQAVARMQFALSETVVLGSGGLGTNQNYLHAIAHHPEVVAGRMHTGFLGTELDFESPKAKAWLIPSPEMTLVLSEFSMRAGESRAAPGSRPNPWRGGARA